MKKLGSILLVLAIGMPGFMQQEARLVPTQIGEGVSIEKLMDCPVKDHKYKYYKS